MRRKFAAVLSLFLVASCASSLSAAGDETPPAMPDAAVQRPVDKSDCVLSAANGGRGGLPEVRMWLTKSLMEHMGPGGQGWNYPSKAKPSDMHYSSWRFWEFGVSDAMLQLISEQATDPQQKPPQLGPYFSAMTNSGITVWSKTKQKVTGMSVDITDAAAVTEAARTDHYIIYGLSHNLRFKGNALFAFTVDKHRHLTVDLVSSTLPAEETGNLQSGLAALDGHVVLSFPDDPAGIEKVRFMVEFILAREPGKLKSGV